MAQLIGGLAASHIPSIGNAIAKGLQAAGPGTWLAVGAFGRLGPEVNRRFDDERLQRVFSFQAMYAGLSPQDALAIYAVIAYMDSVAGVYFPKGGMHALPRALAAAARARPA